MQLFDILIYICKHSYCICKLKLCFIMSLRQKNITKKSTVMMGIHFNKISRVAGVASVKAAFKYVPDYFTEHLNTH